MVQQRRSHNRKTGNKSYRKRFVIACEGSITEKEYFDIFRDIKSITITYLYTADKSAPLYLLKKMKEYLSNNNLQKRKNDEAWIIIDKDEWSVEQIASLEDWTKSGTNQNLALSNPKFEYWILLHFEDGKNIGSSRECSQRLEKCIPDYKKSLKGKITDDMISKAVERAENRDNPPCDNWPRNLGQTTVYRLVKKILEFV